MAWCGLARDGDVLKDGRGGHDALPHGADAAEEDQREQARHARARD